MQKLKDIMSPDVQAIGPDATIREASKAASILFGILALTLPAASSIALAQEGYPPSQIRLVLGFPPGATTDLVARLLAQKLSAQMNTTVIADNKPGANANIATEFVARAKPDGQTLLFNTPALILSRAFGEKLGYDAIKDFAPVALVASSPYVLVVHPSVPANTVNEFIAFLKANPDKLAYGSAGAGSLTHLAALLFLETNGASALHVPYKGAGPALVDLVGGRIAFAMQGQTAVVPMVKDKRVKAMAFTALKRSPLFPDVPTLNEAGMPGFEIGTWFGVLVPANTPSAIVKRLNAEIVKAAQDLDMKARLAQEGVETLGSTPEEYGAYFRNEVERWTRLVKRPGIKPE